MIRIIAFLMEHFHDIYACPEGADLGMLLEDAGFDDDDIHAALLLVTLLNEQPPEFAQPDAAAVRLYTPDETAVLPAEVRGLLHFLTTSGGLTPAQCELVIHALMHLPYEDITVENAKILSALVLWAQRCDMPAELAVLMHGKNIMH